MEESLFVKTGLTIEQLMNSATGASCQLCGHDILHGQTISSIRLVDGNHEVYGHYQCVTETLGPVATLAAIQEGLLPALNTKTMVNHRVIGWEKLSGF